MNLLNLTAEQIKKLNEKTIRDTEKEFENFKSALEKNKCYLCQQELTYFSVYNPCIHWLLRPSGFDKKHFSLVYEKFDYWRINPYLRWLANSEVPFRNINDLVEEKRSLKIIEETIKYRNFEWSFSCSEGDFSGHLLSLYGRKPHYHFQMKINGNIFIKYRDFHIPFTDYDMWVFAVRRGDFDQIKHLEFRGIGMQGAIDSVPPEVLLNSMETTPDESGATWNMQTFVEAAPGKTISGDEIVKLLEESKRTKTPMAKLMRRLKDVKIKTIISPGLGVPPIAARKESRQKRHEI